MAWTKVNKQTPRFVADESEAGWFGGPFFDFWFDGTEWININKNIDGFTSIDKLPTIAGDWFVTDWFVVGWFVGISSWDVVDKKVANWTKI